MQPVPPFAGKQPPVGTVLFGLDVGSGPLTAFRTAPPSAPRGRLLLVPGYTSSKEEFYAMAPLIAAMGWEVWGYSQRGQADSAAPEGVEQYRLDRFAGDAVAVARRIDGPVHILGHSFGGVVAAHAALAAPDLFTSLTLMSAGMRAVTAPWVTEAMVAAAARGGLARWEEKNPVLAGCPAAELPPDDAFRRARMSATSPDHLVGAAGALATFAELTDALAALRLPMHLLHGEQDDVWPAEGQREAAQRIGAHFTALAGVGHSVPREAPGAAAAATTGFLEGVPAA
ncbi:MAG: alpha/beta fold hydrolase [Protaetiibacter sp.]